MADEKEKEKEPLKQETAVITKISGVQPASDGIIERAVKAREELAVQNERLEENIRKLEALRVQQILGGTTQAGSFQKSESEAQKEQHLERWKGQGLNPFKGRGAAALEI